MNMSWLILFEAVFARRYICVAMCARFKGVTIVSVCFGVIMSTGV